MTQPVFAICGLPAGCGLADLWVRVHCIDALDGVVMQAPSVSLDVYIDDLALSAEADDDKKVLEILVPATASLIHAVEEEMGSQVALDKAAALASSPSLAKQLRQALGKYAGTKCSVTAPNLGVDFAPGRARRLLVAGKSKRAGRVADLKRRKQRFLQVRKRVGRRAQIGRFFLQGAHPAFAYGIAVTGIPPSQLLLLRRTLAAARSPYARGTSLTHKMVLHGDDTWRSAVAPALAWAGEVWRALLRDQAVHLTMSELYAAWHACYKGDEPSWASLKGPIAAMRLSLLYIDWRMVEPFAMVDDRGQRIVLTENSPALIEKLMREAMQGMHERKLAKETYTNGDATFGHLLRHVRPDEEASQQGRGEHTLGGRICADIVRTASAGKSRKYTAVEQGCMRAWFCNSIWTRARADAAGFDISPLCPLCGQADDTVWHRLWECTAPQCVSARSEAVPWWLVIKAKQAGPSNMLYAKGIFPHPGDFVPRPLSATGSDRGIRAHTAAGTAVSTASLRLRGHVFIDGSCTRTPIRELNRAAFSVVMVNPSGKAVIKVAAPVWAHLPQTPQAAEYCAYAAAAELAAHGTCVYGDCANVVRDANGPAAAAFSARKAYAGVTRAGRAHEIHDLQGQRLKKVPAHVTMSDNMTATQVFEAVGNSEADAEAKSALSYHPVKGEELMKALNLTIREAKLVVALAAALLPLWPALPAGLKKRHTPGSVGVRAKCEPIRTVLPLTRTCLDDGPWVAGIERVRRDQKGHRVSVLFFDAFTKVQPVAVCARCGAFSSGRFVNLVERCSGKPATRHAMHVIRQLAMGVHPTLGVASSSSVSISDL